MPQQDKLSDLCVNHQVLKEVVDWLLPPALFAGLKVRRAASWTPRMLAVAALLWVTGEETNLTARFVTARKIVRKVFRWMPPPGTTYQGFMKNLGKWHERLLQRLMAHLRTQMKEVLPRQWEIGGYVVFAGDGSRVEVARTESLEEAFSPQRKKKKVRKTKKTRKNQNRKPKKPRRKSPRRQRSKANNLAQKKQSAESVAKKENSPQIWLTLMWHVATGLPWNWRTGPSDSSERQHLEEMKAELPENSLVTADAGFVGYDFWTAILQGQINFLIRVGANVRLLTQLGCARQHDHTVYLWTDAAAKKRHPPLVLRLIVIHDGKHPVYLVTNLSKSQLSDRQAAAIYSARWGVELYFRTFKQTFDCRKLRSRCAKNAELELDWSMLGLWCVCLLGQRELVRAGIDPALLSAAGAIKALQSTLREYRVRPECPQENLASKLRLAVIDGYRRNRSKASRDYPRKKTRRNIGAPKIVRASKGQIKLAQQLMAQQHEFRLTA